MKYIGIFLMLAISAFAYESKDGQYQKEMDWRQDPNTRNTDRWGNTTPWDGLPGKNTQNNTQIGYEIEPMGLKARTAPKSPLNLNDVIDTLLVEAAYHHRTKDYEAMDRCLWRIHDIITFEVEKD